MSPVTYVVRLLRWFKGKPLPLVVLGACLLVARAGHKALLEQRCLSLGFTLGVLTNDEVLAIDPTSLDDPVETFTRYTTLTDEQIGALLRHLEPFRTPAES